MVRSIWVMRVRFVVAALSLAVSGAVSAQAFPSKPIRIIVPAAPGSGPDIIARLLGERTAKPLGQQVIVDNVTGAGTLVASQTAAKATPDGHTLYIAGVGALITDRYMFKSLPYDGERDFLPVAMLYESAALALVVHPSVPANTIAELIAQAKANPGKLNYGTGGGGVVGMIGDWFVKAGDAPMVAVTYKSPAQMLQDVVGGRIQVVYASISAVESFRKSGQLRMLGVSSPNRFPVLPDVPAIAETIPGFRIQGIGILTAPAATPATVVQRLNREVDAVAREPEYRQRLNVMGLDSSPGAGTPQSIGEFLKGERTMWAKVIAGLNVQPE